MILAVHRQRPNWPADPARPVIEKTVDGETYWVETDGGGGPVDDDVRAILNPVVVPTFRASDLIDTLTADDLVAIESAVAADAELRLTWIRLCSRGENPVSTSFRTKLAGLVDALGDGRASEIADELSVASVDGAAQKL
jgi:hypothetical protein